MLAARARPCAAPGGVTPIRRGDAGGGANVANAPAKGRVAVRRRTRMVAAARGWVPDAPSPVPVSTATVGRGGACACVERRHRRAGGCGGVAADGQAGGRARAVGPCGG
ncbi:hypothetical protein BU14_1965s0001 [Porphyra umbilicalis]|uniref:Uncharacterized protein n=1 Tax=Porphyra umbilicalis TaxID=2786 RepID=A0A1X6NKK8_PORUM|nr:hypothetical protein BU14_1965s0001 [Porphyra umbilicalis]|eukprot:OSX69016.1 hypothetical protein BU14_1965s0001 [Porphyra umbilicalis]